MRNSVQRSVLLCALLVYWAPAHAYLDPGTGSAIIQGLIATIAALAATLRIYWFRVQGFFAKKKSDKSPSEDIESEEA